jgi:hypothetical protein
MEWWRVALASRSLGVVADSAAGVLECGAVLVLAHFVPCRPLVISRPSSSCASSRVGLPALGTTGSLGMGSTVTRLALRASDGRRYGGSARGSRWDFGTTGSGRTPAASASGAHVALFVPRHPGIS